MISMTYEEAMNYLAGLGRFGHLGLGRIEKLLNRLGDPHRRLRVIHVAGTNGKGSTASMIASILEAAGYRVGLYTSPHLERFTERIRCCGQEVSREDVARIVSELRPLIDEMAESGDDPPTEFETITVLAFLYFLEQDVDFAVLEVGLGGRYDATNVIPSPLVSAITSISLDHTDRLGKTVGEIAWEKAGIIKPGRPVVSAAGDEAAEAVIEKVCRDSGSPLYRVGRDIRWRQVSCALERQEIDVEGIFGRYPGLVLGLSGRHQQANAAAAIGAVEILGHAGDEAIRRGLREVRWPGRLEVIRKEPLLIIDGAHNPAGARALKEAVRNLVPDRRMVLLVGILGDKAMDGILRELVPLAAEVVVTRVNYVRALDVNELARRVSAFGIEPKITNNAAQGVDEALRLAGPEDLVLCTGSL